MGQLSVRSNGAEGWVTQGSLFDFRQGKNFSVLRRAQTGSGVHSAFYSINTGTVGPGLRQLVHKADRSTHSSAYTSPYAFRPCTRIILPLSRTWHVVTSRFMRNCKKRNLHNVFMLHYAFSLEKNIYISFVSLGNSYFASSFITVANVMHDTACKVASQQDTNLSGFSDSMLRDCKLNIFRKKIAVAI